jgi:hypothetical protein
MRGGGEIANWRSEARKPWQWRPPAWLTRTCRKSVLQAIGSCWPGYPVECVFQRMGQDRRQTGLSLRLVWTQAVHWIAVLVAMNIMLLAGIQQLLPAPSTSLILPMLLALGYFLAGANLASPRTLFSQADFGSRRAGGLVGQTIYALRHSRRSLRGRHWHDHLVKQKRK